MTACPICSTPRDKRYASTPYWTCHGCGVWFQHPTPPKLYQNSGEHDLEAMPERDKGINRELAGWLYTEVMNGKPGPTLDIGCKHPVMAARLAEFGCEAHAIDAVEPTRIDGVKVTRKDFEVSDDGWIALPFALITLVHVFEHFYDPVAMMRKLRRLLADDGALFLRLPCNDVRGFEHDLTEHHYSIHPFYHSLSSIAELCARTDCFVVERYHELLPGQRDIVLRPI